MAENEEINVFENIQMLVEERRVQRGSFTKCLKTFYDLLDDNNVKECGSKLCVLKEKMARIKIVDDQIRVMTRQIWNAEEWEKEIDNCEEYYERMVTAEYEYNEVCGKGTLKLERLGGSVCSVVSNEESIHSSVTKLPKLKLEQFDLSPSNWLSFWTQFDRINKDKSLEDEVKFQYLRMSLLGKAKSLIDTYPNTKSNYCKALDHLKSRYGREDLIVNAVYKELLGLLRSQPSLTQLYDVVSAKVRCLETFGFTSEKAAIIVPLIEECLPTESRKLWERRIVKDNENKLDALMLFLGKEAEACERITLSKLECNENVPLATAAALVTTYGNESHSVKYNKGRNNKGYDYGKGKAKGKELKCCFCSGSHFNKDCNVAMTVQKRREIVKSAKLCFACLRYGHSISSCHTRVDCIKCKGRHYALVCNDNATKRETEGSTTNMFAGQQPNEAVVLQTFLVKVGDLQVRILLDPGSHRCYITERLRKRLNLVKVGEEKFKHMLFGGRLTDVVQHDLYNITLRSLDSKGVFTCKILEQANEICGAILNDKVLKEQLATHGIVFTDDSSLPIDILLGADVMAKLIISVRPIGSLLAIETVLGWCLMGSYENKFTSSSMVNFAMSMFNCNLPSLWELESLGIEKPPNMPSENSLECVDHFKQNVKFTDEGRYSVRLPWIESHPSLPTNYELAKTRLHQVLNRLERNGLYSAYDEIFGKWEQDGIIEKIESDDRVGHYIPHRPVIRDGKTTKIRPVFDASAKAVNRVSLNDCLHSGPNLISDLVSLLLKFRLEEVGVIADIQQAFLMIALDDVTDKDMLRFLWYSDGRLITYRHCRVVFGLTSSPFLLNATITYHLQQFEGPFVEHLRRSFYVDDCITSLPSISLANEFRIKACEVLGKACFNLRGWVMSGDEGDHLVLGLRWLAKEDVIGCREPKFEMGKEWTKKELLSLVGRIYDPIGILAAPVLYLKLLLQKCFKLKLTWDELIPNDLKASIDRWVSEIHLINSILIPRNIKSNSAHLLQLHVFCDASKVGIGTCVFLRSVEQGRVNVSFVTGKARVSPLDSLSIPRLELIAAVMGARLGSFVSKALSIEDVTYWSDSMVTLYWIKKGEWRTFVGNRVKEVRQLADSKRWRFVMGEKNPADIISRGCLLSKYVYERWWEGPDWLTQPSTEWPVVAIEASTDALAEAKTINFLNVAKDESLRTDLFSYFSSFKKNVRVMGWIYRFVGKVRKKSVECSEDLTGEELIMSEKRLVKWIQSNYSLDTGDLAVKVDEEGVLRLKSKILSDQFSASFKEPILLPHCSLVESFLAEVHRKLHHAGVSTVLSVIREEYWIVRGRRLARRVLSKCLRCRLHKVKPVAVPPVGLPNNRVNLGKAFQVCGCDLAGPLFLKNQNKVWIVLFTCAVYRAVHLELVDSLTTEAFLMALRRMIARRGRVTTMYSDNGTNFVGAWNLITRTTVESQMKIRWLFNAPTAAWWGGFWERLIRIMKGLLKSTLGKAALNMIELTTILYEIEAVMNSRPITYMSDDPSEINPITPAMFLQEESNSVVPDLDQVDTTSLACRVRYIAQMRVQLKERFKREYLGALLMKSSKNADNVKIGELVWVSSDQKKRIDWDLALVLEVIPGKDGVTRVAKVKTSKGVLVRPVQRLCKMEMECNGGLTPTDNVDVDLDIVEEFSPLETEVTNVQPIIITRAGRVVRKPNVLDW